MSGFKIEDGKGKGNTAAVSSDQKLEVLATSHHEEHSISVRLADAYFANSTDTADTLTIAAATDTPVLYVQNDSENKLMIIEKILTSADTAGGVVKWIKNPDLGTIGSHNIHVPVNLNFSSGKAPLGTFYSWDEAGGAGLTGLSGGTTVKSFITELGYIPYPIDGAIVLAQGDSLQINYLIAGGGEFECGVRFYYDVLEGE